MKVSHQKRVRLWRSVTVDGDVLRTLEEELGNYFSEQRSADDEELRPSYSLDQQEGVSRKFETLDEMIEYLKRSIVLSKLESIHISIGDIFGPLNVHISFCTLRENSISINGENGALVNGLLGQIKRILPKNYNFIFHGFLGSLTNAIFALTISILLTWFLIQFNVWNKTEEFRISIVGLFWIFFYFILLPTVLPKRYKMFVYFNGSDSSSKIIEKDSKALIIAISVPILLLILEWFINR